MAKFWQILLMSAIHPYSIFMEVAKRDSRRKI
jgi:hypothetical protein